MPPIPVRHHGRPASRGALRITVIYLVVGIAWIFLSDHLLQRWLGHGDDTLLQNFKGVLYVAVTGAMLYLLIFRLTRTLVQHQLELERRNSTLAMIFRCNEAMVRSADESTLFKSTCEAIVKTGGHRMAWVALADGDDTVFPTAAAMAGHNAGYCAEVAALNDCPALTTVRTGQIVAFNDIARDVAPDRQWRAAAIERGYESCLSIPLKQDGTILGALIIFSGTAHAIDDEARRLLIQLADDLAFGVTTIRSRVRQQAAEEQLRLLGRAIRQSPSLVIITNDEGVIEYANPCFARVTGYSLEESIGQTPRMVKSGEHSSEFYAGLWKTIKDGHEWRGELCNRRKNGELYWVLATISPVRDASGQVTHFVAVQEDITARRHADEELQKYRLHLEELVQERTIDLERANWALAGEVAERERAQEAEQEARQFFQSALDALVANIAVIDAQGQVVMVNAAWRRFAEANGYAKLGSAGLGVNYLEVCQNAQGQDRESALMAADGIRQVLSGRRDEYYMEYPCHGSEKRWFMMRVSRFPGHVANRFVIAHFEVTQIKAAEAALRESEQRFRILADEAPVMIWMTDSSMKCEYLNASWLHFRARTLEQECEGRSQAVRGLAQGIHAEDRDTFMAAMREASQVGKPQRTEFRLLRFDGIYRWILGTIVPRYDAKGDFVGCIGSGMDISEMKEAERIKDDLVATVNHELRTPLASLRGYVELLLEREYDADRQREFLNVIYEESVRLGQLIDDFLDIQRMESGRLQYNFSPVAIKPLAEDVATLQLFNSNRHVARVEVPDGLPAIHADAERIRQVVQNMVSNAVKFSPGGGEIVIGARQEGGRIVVWVRDQGVGIPARAIKHLFNKFFRVNEAIVRNIQGTGLGLSIVKQIIDAHRGEVWVESQLGKGSTFYFSVPTANEFDPGL